MTNRLTHKNSDRPVRSATAGDLDVVFASGITAKPSAIVALDANIDIAILELMTPSAEAPLKIDLSQPIIGACLHAWGFPLAYSGPAPILSVGYLAGFEARTLAGITRRRMIINGALNPGNSGGPVVEPSSGALLGMAVTKHAPIRQDVLEALEDLSQRTDGFYASNPRGGPSRNESQIIADVLQYLRSMTQVVIGEAIPAEDIAQFLTENKVPWHKAARAQ